MTRVAVAHEDAVRAAIVGRMFHTNRKIAKEGEPLRHVPHERALEMDDVLASKLVDGRLVLVTKDGVKHRVQVDAKAEKTQKAEK